MKSSSILLRGVRVKMPAVSKSVYAPPSLLSISANTLPNNSFEKQNLYHVTRSAIGSWPVYKKVQNTKITTEIKRVKGNVRLFAEELSRVLFKNNIPKNYVKVNTLTGEVNIKGDRSSDIKKILSKMI